MTHGVIKMNFLKKLCSNFYTLAFTIFISGLISVYDNVMNVIFYDTLPIDERNPLASKIIDWYGVKGLVEIKATGTVLAVIVMLLLAKTRYKFVVYPVFLVQLWLFYYLTFHVNSMTNFLDTDFGLPIRLFLEFYREALSL
tara:strand:- start:744 stop:1166 length:423 start_codon:yes stop_codon:yes gene_type:complete